MDIEEKIRDVLRSDRRYPREAYDFVAQALSYTIDNLGRHEKEGDDRHVSAGELLEGIRQVAQDEFGPLSPMVFDGWGIRTSSDFGEIVYNLVNSGIWHKTDRDSKEDFSEGFDIRSAFQGELDVRIED